VGDEVVFPGGGDGFGLKKSCKYNQRERERVCVRNRPYRGVYGADREGDPKGWFPLLITALGSWKKPASTAIVCKCEWVSG
jgi:hypothetical protein